MSFVYIGISGLPLHNVDKCMIGLLDDSLHNTLNTNQEEDWLSE